jgi:hypothetical protein
MRVLFVSFRGPVGKLLCISPGVSLGVSAVILAAVAIAGCAPPKVLVDHSYASTDKSLETLIQRSGESVGSGSKKANLFDVYLRVCNQAADNSQSSCKDSLVLENVNPNSL